MLNVPSEHVSNVFDHLNKSWWSYLINWYQDKDWGWWLTHWQGFCWLCWHSRCYKLLSPAADCRCCLLWLFYWIINSTGRKLQSLSVFSVFNRRNSYQLSEWPHVLLADSGGVDCGIEHSNLLLEQVETSADLLIVDNHFLHSTLTVKTDNFYKYII